MTPRSWSLGLAVTFAWMSTLSACAHRGVGAGKASSLIGAEAAGLQRATLDTIFYRGNPLPPQPDADERARARALVERAPEWERELLQELYPNDPELWALAIRDSDGDGIKDYRISDYYGRFLEGDTDLDGDDQPNLRDLEPYQPDGKAPGAAGARSVPDHLSWRLSGKPSQVVAIQERLFREYGVLLVERSAKFTPELAVAVSDALELVHRAALGPEGLPTLRVIATVESSVLFADAEEGAGDFAQVLPATGTMEVYRRGIDAPPLVQLGFLSHEVSHAVQYALDFDETRRREIVLDNEVKAPKFHALVAKYGWSRQALEDNPAAHYSLFRPQYISPDAYEYLYREEGLAAWEDWLTSIYEEVGEANYLTDPRITELHILGDYSISGPWEWCSDHVIAHAYMAMFDSLRSGCSEAEVAELLAATQTQVLSPQWPYFRFENARGAAFQDHLQAAQPVQPSDAKDLARRYIAGADRCLD